MKTRWMLVLLISIVALLLAACGGQSTSAESADKTATEPVDVQVTLKEMSIQSSLTTFTKGVPYHFIVTDQGTLNHEFMIMPVLEKTGGMEMEMEEMDEMALAVIEEDDLAPGTTQTVDVTFTERAPEGQLEFACHVPGHYEGGMHLPIVVK